MKQVNLSIVFQGFGSIRSTQPTTSIREMLGFTQFLFDGTSMEQSIFLLCFRVLVASVQPNLRHRSVKCWVSLSFCLTEHLWSSQSFYYFSGFGRIRSTQPTTSIREMLGFTQFLFDRTSMKQVNLSIIFRVLVASVQPNLRHRSVKCWVSLSFCLTEHLWSSQSFYYFSGFGRIRSTQPTD